MLGLLDQSKVVSVGRRVVLLGSSICKNSQTFNGEPNQIAAKNWLINMEKLLRALNYLNLSYWYTPIGDNLMSNLVLKYCIRCIEGRELLADLVLLCMILMSFWAWIGWLFTMLVCIVLRKRWCLGLQVNQS